MPGQRYYWHPSAGPVWVRWLAGTLPDVAHIDLPMRMLWGRHDPLAPVAWADRLLDAYFGNYTIDFVDAGHFVHFELPDVAAREVRGFFCR